MPRRASSKEGIDHLRQLMIRPHGLVRITLRDGQQIVGVEVGSRDGNNAQEAMLTGHWEYWAEVTIVDVEGRERAIDLLDVLVIEAAPDQRDELVAVLRQRGMARD